MSGATVLLEARRGASLTQRQLAERTGVPQPAIARIESGKVVPRVDTLDRLLAGCHRMLGSVPRPGTGIDRSAIRALLELTPAQRARLATREAWNLSRVLAAVRA